MLKAKKILQDMADGRYDVYSSADRHIEFKIFSKKLVLACEDYGEEPQH